MNNVRVQSIILSIFPPFSTPKRLDIANSDSKEYLFV